MVKKVLPPKPAKDLPKKKSRISPFSKILSKYLHPTYMWLASLDKQTMSDLAFRNRTALYVDLPDAAFIRVQRLRNRKNSPNPKWRRNGSKAATESLDDTVRHGASYCATKIKDMLMQGEFIEYTSDAKDEVRIRHGSKAPKQYM